MASAEKDWKLKLRYGKLQTPYKHYTLIAEGIAGNTLDDFSCRAGNAFMGIKVWAVSYDQAAEILQAVAEDQSFSLTNDIKIFDSDPQQPPAENPYGYDINFTPFKKD
jgi:hypothetical protein